MAFVQLTYRESLRDIEACLGAQPARLYHLGIRGNVTRSNLYLSPFPWAPFRDTKAAITGEFFAAWIPWDSARMAAQDFGSEK